MTDNLETSVSWLGRLVESPADADWQRLVHIYSPLISKWCFRAGVSIADIDDIVQDVLIVVIRRVNEFRHAHFGAFRGWLRVILANHLKNYFRAQTHRNSLLPLDDVSDPNSELSRSFGREHDTLLALRAMGLVKPDFQASTWLAFLGQVVEGRNAHEVSEELQMSLNAVIKAKSRVLRRIRAELQYLL